MEISIPHSVSYDVSDRVSVDDLIDSLQGTQAAIREIDSLLEGCIGGLTVDKINVSVSSISQESPLRELFFVSLVVTYKEDLEREVPAMIERWFGVSISEEYDTLLTVCVMIVIFYGADYLYRKFKSGAESNKIKQQLDGLIQDLATETGHTESEIRKTLDSKYDNQRMRRVARAASRFFKPSKRQGNASVTIGTRPIKKEVVQEIPGDIADDALDPEETSQQYFDVEVELHAQDRDYAKKGWAAVIPSLSKQRMTMHIFPPIKPEDLWTRQQIRGDVIVVFKKQDGELKPSQCHLVKLTE